MNKDIFLKNFNIIANGKSQKEMAEIMKCGTSSLSRYLNSERPDFPPVDALAELCTHFKVSLDWLIGLNSKQEEGELTTYSDLFRLILKLIDGNDPDIIMNWEVSFTEEPPDLPFGDSVTLSTNDDIAVNFLSNWQEIYQLYTRGTIKRELYDLWLTDQLKRYKDELLPRLPFN